jgi:hypothetical protein
VYGRREIEVEQRKEKRREISNEAEIMNFRNFRWADTIVTTIG